MAEKYVKCFHASAAPGKAVNYEMPKSQDVNAHYLKVYGLDTARSDCSGLVL